MSVNKEIREEEKKNGLIVFETKDRFCSSEMGGWDNYSVMYNPQKVDKEDAEEYVEAYIKARNKGVDFNALSASKGYDIICLPKCVMNNLRRMIKEQYDMIPKTTTVPPSEDSKREPTELEKLVSAISDNSLLSKTQSEEIARAIEHYVDSRIDKALEDHIYNYEHNYDNHGMD